MFGLKRLVAESLWIPDEKLTHVLQRSRGLIVVVHHVNPVSQKRLHWKAVELHRGDSLVHERSTNDAKAHALEVAMRVHVFVGLQAGSALDCIGESSTNSCD
jgi:hypothetical protein